MKKIVTLRHKMYNSLTNDNHVRKKKNDTNKCVIK